MKHRKRNRHGRFVSNPGFFTSPWTYAIGIPGLAIIGYFGYRLIIKKKPITALPKPAIPLRKSPTSQQSAA